MIGSNYDSNSIITTLSETAQNLGASDNLIEEAMKNQEGSDYDSRKIIGLLKLIASLSVGGEETDIRVAAHNTSESAHNDIRLLIEGLSTRLAALVNTDETTLAQIAEIVAYIESNKDIIEGITTNKVNVSDIVDNLTTNASDRPLSAKQGVALKALIPTMLSSLLGDSTHRTVTDDEKTTWNSKSNFSGKYEDLSGIPTDLVKSNAITLGIHTDGLVYVFIDGQPVGTGIAFPTPEV